MTKGRNIPADPAPAKPSLTSPHIEIAATLTAVRVHGYVDPATLCTVLQWLAR